MDTPMPAPVACTLSPEDFKSRARWLKEFTAEALLDYRIEGVHAHLRYKLDKAEGVAQLVRQESRCCGFLQFRIVHAGDAVHLHISGPEEASSDAQALLAHLISGDEAQMGK